MAEQFIIRVQLDGQTGNVAPQRNTTPQNANAGTSLVAVGTTNLNRRELAAAVNTLKPTVNSIKNLEKRYDELREAGAPKGSEESYEANLGRLKNVIESRKYLIDEFSILEEQLAAKEPILSPRRTIGIASAMALKITQAAISTTQHRSGNQYFNQQLSRGLSTASTVGGIAVAALFNPTLALVAAGGLLVNSGVDLFTTAANYDYDRKLDTMMIHNVKEVSGNISYGRRGGTR